MEQAIPTTNQPVFRLINSETRPLTREYAEQFRNLEASPTEREMSKSRVTHLREKADAGQLVSFGWSTARLDGKIFRMNGQHSSAMLCGLDGNFPEGLKVHLDEYEVRDRNALVILFRQFDDRKSGRSPADVSGAYQGLFDDLKTVPRDAAKLGCEGVNWYRRHVEGIKVHAGDDAYQLMGEGALHPFLQWLGDLFSIKTPELKRQPVISAIYGTFIVNEDEARKFWEDVAHEGSQYDDDAPASALDAWLKSIAEKQDEMRGLKPGQIYQGCVFAWNALRANRSITAIKCDTKKGLHRPT